MSISEQQQTRPTKDEAVRQLAVGLSLDHIQAEKRQIVLKLFADKYVEF